MTIIPEDQNGPRDLQWANPERTAINMTLDHPRFGEIPFTASLNDPEAHGRELFRQAFSGAFGAISAG